MFLARNSKRIEIHVKRTSLSAVGVIRMVTTSDAADASSKSLSGVHVRALTLSSALSGMTSGWMQLGDAVFALCNISPQHVGTTLCPSEGLLWLRTTLIWFLRMVHGTWMSAASAELPTMVALFDSAKRVVEMITIAHTSMVPPESLGFTLGDGDVVPRPHAEVVAPRSGIPLQASGSADGPMDDVPAAEEAEDAEVPVPERDEGGDPTEVVIDGVKLDSNSSLRTLRSACESLGLAAGGSKMKCLKRLWDHLQAQVLIASHGARRELQGEMQRPVHAQSVPVEPTAKEVSDHNMAHQPYAAWCELCVANKAMQDPHLQRVEASGEREFRLWVCSTV